MCSARICAHRPTNVTLSVVRPLQAAVAAVANIKQQATHGGRQRPAVHERLYESALLAKEKLEAERRQREKELTAATKSDKVVMSQVKIA
jgi:hypothetical protein